MTETATYSKNDVFYTCSLIEYIGRVTKNHRKDVVSALGTNGVKAILDSADVFHCQSFEQSADEICELFPVPEGTYDTGGIGLSDLCSNLISFVLRGGVFYA